MPGLLGAVPSGGQVQFEWMGSGYSLTASSKLSDHERRLLRSIGMVLSARYQLLTNEELAAQSFQLFRGLPEDRFVSAFLDPTPHASAEAIAEIPDRVADAIEVLRTSSMSTYENRRIATGVLLFGSMPEPCHAPPQTPTTCAALFASAHQHPQLSSSMRRAAHPGAGRSEWHAGGADRRARVGGAVSRHAPGGSDVGYLHRSLPGHLVRRAHLPDPLAQRRDQDLFRWRAGVPLHRRQMAAGGCAASLWIVEEGDRQCGTGGTAVRGGAESDRKPARRAVRRARRTRVGFATGVAAGPAGSSDHDDAVDGVTSKDQLHYLLRDKSILDVPSDRAGKHRAY